MTRRWRLARGYLWGAASGVTLGGLVAVVAAGIVVLAGDSGWRDHQTPASLFMFLVGFAAFGIAVAAIAALGALMALTLLTRLADTGAAARILSVAAGSSLAVVIAGFVYSAATRDSTTPYLVLFLAVPTAGLAGVVAVIVELRARSARRRAHGEFSPSTNDAATHTVET